MADAFLSLPTEDRAEILNTYAAELGRSAVVLEKDVWVCWALKSVFAMPDRKTMAFKGGTSLSKVFDAIQRFSEYIDITIDYRAFEIGADPFAAASNTQRKKVGESLKAALKDHVHTKILPFLRSEIESQMKKDAVVIEADEEGEKVWIRYPSALEGQGGYITDHVLLEFGARNITDPSDKKEVRAFLEKAGVKGVEFPRAEPNVLDPRRTFWEKATLIHVKCNQNDLSKALRLSRHWYDLAKLESHDIGRSALANRELLADVVKHKKVFFAERNADYDACTARGLRLLPDEPLRTALVKDFEEMKAAAMFYDSPPTFEDILAKATALAKRMNEKSN